MKTVERRARMSMINKLPIVALLATITSSVFGMVFDNRYLPLLQKPYISIPGRPSHLAANFFATTGSTAIDNKQKTIGIPELNGEFDLGQLDLALIKLGLRNPMRSDLVGQPIPMRLDGVIQSQGLEFSYFQSICDIFGFGFDWLVMRLYSSQEFRPARGQINYVNGVPNAYIDDVRREIFEELGLTEAFAIEAGMGDLDVYAKLWHYWDYVLKMRRIEAGFRFGALVPAGVTRQNYSPASIPFGGNGLWGAYGQLDSEFELREDMKVGIMFRLSKRIAKVQSQRLPVIPDGVSSPSATGQPQIFAATVGDVLVNPGVNFVFSPYAMMENIRAGLGLRVVYTYTNHSPDLWSNPVPVPTKTGTIPAVDLTLINQNSAWKTDYVSITVFYDFGKVKVERTLEPILIFNWDIPSLFFGSDMAVNSHKVSLGLEINF